MLSGFVFPLQICLRNNICTTCNFCYNFLSHTHIIFLLSLSIGLVSVSILTFLYKFTIVSKVDTLMVQITHLNMFHSYLCVEEHASNKQASNNFNVDILIIQSWKLKNDFKLLDVFCNPRSTTTKCINLVFRLLLGL